LIPLTGDRDQVEEESIVKDQEETDSESVEKRYVMFVCEFASSFSGRETTIR
jgi:hypothetical protein